LNEPKLPLLKVCSGTVFRTKGHSVKAAAITDGVRGAGRAEVAGEFYLIKTMVFIDYNRFTSRG